MQERIQEPGLNAPVTLRDIAEKLKISHSTVSRALQNASKISLARRKEVQEAAREMGYRPNAIATRLGHQRHAHQRQSISSEIAWLNYWTDPKALRRYREFDMYWKGAKQRAEEGGYRLEEFTCGNELSPARLEKILIARDIYGILIPPHGGFEAPKGWNEIDWKRFSSVRFGNSTTVPRTHIATSNHLASSILAIENMNRLGYQRIGFVATHHQHLYFRAGFLLMQTKAQAPVFTFARSLGTSKDLAAFGSWLKKYRFDAILSDTPRTHDLLIQLGYRVPDDIGLAATSVLDGNADAGIDQHSEEIGKAAMETLLSLLNHNQAGIPDIIREVVITGSWVNGRTLPSRAKT